MKTKSDPRHVQRIITLQKLFEQEFHANAPYELSELASMDKEKRAIDMPFIEKTVRGVLTHTKAIDAIIKQYTVKRPFEDTAKIDLLILRIALYELFFTEIKTPVKVVIDEAIELGKEFGGSGSATFINGILGSIANNAGPHKTRKTA